MKTNNLLDSMQSACHAGYSTETAPLRVHNDIMMSVDECLGVFLVLVDLSAAFDTVDHDILVSFMKDFVGVDETGLKFLKSSLSNRSQCVSIAGVLSECNELAHGVPQGSQLGLILFCTCTTALGVILRSYNIKCHIYADKTQLYCSFDFKSLLVGIEKIQSCTFDIKS